MPCLPKNSAILGALALAALTGSFALAGSKQPAGQHAKKPSGNEVAVESVTIVHEAIRPSKQDRLSNSMKQNAAPPAVSSQDDEWKYLSVRRY